MKLDPVAGCMFMARLTGDDAGLRNQTDSDVFEVNKSRS